jgi:biopolymer transport protein ExbD
MAEEIQGDFTSDGEGADPYVAKKKERRRQKALLSRIEGEFELNLNAMIDMMTVLLVFLLKQYSSDPVSISESADLRLPHSNTDQAVKDSVAISVTKKWVMVEDDAIVPINDGQIDPSSLQSAESVIIPVLQQKVEQKLEDNAAWAKQFGRPETRIATIIADSDTPYRVLIQVMTTAGAAGIQNFKFAAMQRAQGSGVSRNM